MSFFDWGLLICVVLLAFYCLGLDSKLIAIQEQLEYDRALENIPAYEDDAEPLDWEKDPEWAEEMS